jgi:hypothetical protein
MQHVEAGQRACELEARLFYYEHVVGHYFPLRYRLLYPMFLLRGMEQVLLWICDPDNRHRRLVERLRATIDLVKSLPRVLAFQRFSASDVRRVPRLEVTPVAQSTKNGRAVHEVDVALRLLPSAFHGGLRRLDR